jgi:DNA-binding LytR/AlgR family response regulator
VQGSCGSLDQYHEQMERIRPCLAEFAERLDVNFISASRSHADKDENDSEVLWLPCEGGHKQIQTSMIDKVEAEGDYMRVFIGEWSCLLHVTMTRLANRLPSTHFIKLHRSSLVRVGFIERLVHKGHRWTALLHDGSRVGIAKSHVRAVLQLVKAESSLVEADSSKRGSFAEEWSNPAEKRAMTV